MSESTLLRDKAESIVNNYCSFHAVGAITVGAFGGQFGADRVVLTYLTRRMILKICDLYGIKDKKARTIHVAAAITRLTITGTALAHTVLNYIPGGSLVNGATTYYLTRSAGLKCISEIEQGKMTVNDQLKIGAKDVTIALVKHGINDIVEFDSNSMEDIVDESIVMHNDLLLDESKELTTLSNFIKALPNEAVDGVNTIVYNTLKTSFIKALQNDFKWDRIDWGQVLGAIVLDTIKTGINSYKGLSNDELVFRLNVKDENFSKKMSSFITASCKEFDKKEKQENILNALKSVIGFIQEFFNIQDELTSEKLYRMVFDNEYDKEIEKTYRFFFSNIENESHDRNVWLRCAYCYNNLARINQKYKKPDCHYAPLDDKLIFYIAGQVRLAVKTMQNRPQEVIAYCISEFIRKHNDILQIY